MTKVDAPSTDPSGSPCRTQTQIQCLTCRDTPILHDPVVILIHAMGRHQLVEVPSPLHQRKASTVGVNNASPELQSTHTKTSSYTTRSIMAVNSAETNVALSNTGLQPASPETVLVADIVDTDRQRKDYGDITELARSIKQYGIIQPIVVTRRSLEVVLVAGGRRLAACRYLGIINLVHARDFIWREELNNDSNQLQLQAVELEENLRRKELHWTEQIAAKHKLLQIMQGIHGESQGYGQGRSSTDGGFGIRTLAAMLGENPSTTSRDIELASFVAKHPILAKLPTKADAVRKLGVAVTVARMQNTARNAGVTSPTPRPNVAGVESTGDAGVGTDVLPDAVTTSVPLQETRWQLYEGSFQDNIGQVDPETIDLVCTDLPYNIGLGSSSAAHGAGLGQFSDTQLDIGDLCRDVACESFRVMRDDRFGVFFYGMNYHQVLYDALTLAGFNVDGYPFIWLRDRTAPPDGFARYSKSYDPALIASKGTPRFIRPNLPNTFAVPSVRGPERLHAAQKPIGIMEKFILDMTTEDCTVLDMFAGAGTTGVAALQNKRRCILFELESANCVLIRSRLGAIQP